MRTISVSRFQLEHDAERGGGIYVVSSSLYSGVYGLRPVDLDDGYQVAGHRLRAVPASDVDALVSLADALVAEVLEARDAGAPGGTDQIGLLVDDGVARLEVSRHYDDRDAAMAAARESGARVIWDWAADEAVAVD